MKYVEHVPRKLPDGQVLFHNRVHAQWQNHLPGVNGFRAWTQPSEDLPKKCGAL
jgi:hypothetical protein